MIAILKVGTCCYAMEAKDATKVLELLSKGCRVEHAYYRSGNFYHPPDERCFRDELRVEMVDEAQIVAREPKEGEPMPPVLPRKPRRITGPNAGLLPFRT